MRELTKSMLSFSWAMPLYGMKQMLNLTLPRDMSRPFGEAADGFNSVTGSMREQLGSTMKSMFDAGDQIQRSMVDVMFNLGFGVFDPNAWMQRSGQGQGQGSPGHDQGYGQSSMGYARQDSGSYGQGSGGQGRGSTDSDWRVTEYKTVPRTLALVRRITVPGRWRRAPAPSRKRPPPPPPPSAISPPAADSRPPAAGVRTGTAANRSRP